MKEVKQIIGFDKAEPGEEKFFSINPSTNGQNEVVIDKASPGQVNTAAEKAHTAFQLYRKKTGEEKAVFLDAIAAGIEASGEDLILTCISETALPRARIEGERTRTINQLKMFSDLLREGSWVDARIDKAKPERVPVPKPDLRLIYMGLGPVAVFGAGNFPLAFSVAGGDTASALAAGCPVVVKAHPAHPATSAIVGKAIQDAARSTGMPDGVFSLLFDDGIETGMQLVQHPLIKAVGFTGSFRGGKAIYDAAVRRAEPIPVYAEMGSSNPVFVLPGAAKERGQQIAAAYAASVTLGVGQFCTNPGMFIYKNPDADFAGLLKSSFESTAGGVMLAPYIHKAYQEALTQRRAVPGVQQLATGKAGSKETPNLAMPELFSASGEVFSRNDLLAEEIFGPSGIVITTDSKEEMIAIATNLRGQLTATVHGNREELEEYRELLDILSQKAGRIVINAFPTGVEVCPSMVHGGPFPATTDSRSTSVGTAAIYRFVRPVCYQDMPQSMLPAELQDDNPLAISRIVDGIRSNAGLPQHNERIQQ